MTDVTGKVAVVTGGGNGIGLATSEALAAAGATVYIGDINEKAGLAAAESIRAKGQKAEFVRLDVTDDESISSFASTVLEKEGKVSIVANVAGWGKIQPFMENDPDFWDLVVDLNLMGPMKVTRAFLDSMIEQKEGKIVVVSSDAGRVGSMGEAAYSGAKGGAIAFCKGLAREMARYNIHVNAVCPGPTDTALLAAVPEKHREAFVRATPMRRLAKPSEIANTILFFSSPSSDFITGQVISVSGGISMHG